VQKKTVKRSYYKMLWIWFYSWFYI